jgi:hypothetical protein
MIVISWPHLWLWFSPSRETCPFSGCSPSLTGRSRRHRNCHADHIALVSLQYGNSPCAETCFRLHAARYCDVIWGKGKVPLHIIQVTYSWSYIISALQTSSQLHAPAALPLMKEPPTCSRTAPEPVWTFQGDTLLALPGIEPRFLACPPSSLVTMPTELTRLLWHYLTYVHSV